MKYLETQQSTVKSTKQYGHRVAGRRTTREPRQGTQHRSARDDMHATR